MSVSSKPAWFTKQVLAQSGLSPKTKTNTNEQKRVCRLKLTTVFCGVRTQNYVFLCVWIHKFRVVRKFQNDPENQLTSKNSKHKVFSVYDHRNMSYNWQSPKKNDTYFTWLLELFYFQCVLSQQALYVIY